MKTSLKSAVAIAAILLAGACAASSSVTVPVCAKADLPAGTKYFSTSMSPSITSAMAAAVAANHGQCFSRLGRLGDAGYALGNVVLTHISESTNLYGVYVDTKYVGNVIRTKASSDLSDPDISWMPAVVTSLTMESGRPSDFQIGVHTANGNDYELDSDARYRIGQTVQVGEKLDSKKHTTVVRRYLEPVDARTKEIGAGVKF